MEKIKVKIKAAPDIKLPAYATEGSSGMDVRASEGVLLKSGAFCAVPTGLFPEIPSGYEIQVRPRSGLAFKHGVTVLNAPGTIDSDYRGEIKVILINHGPEDFRIEPGERIAQLVFARVAIAELERVEEIADTERSSGGFGSTGRK